MTLAISLAGPEMLIILAVVLLMFGSKKVPELARSLGTAQREFKEGVHDASTAKPEVAQPEAVQPAPVAPDAAPANDHR